jgi:hypothetical protein
MLPDFSSMFLKWHYSGTCRDRDTQGGQSRIQVSEGIAECADSQEIDRLSVHHRKVMQILQGLIINPLPCYLTESVMLRTVAYAAEVHTRVSANTVDIYITSLYTFILLYCWVFGLYAQYT